MNISIALAGQPNCGKSTIFNMLTGARQHIANYPGVTVDKKFGAFSYQGTTINVVDLPGTYSLTSFSLEERVARDFLIEQNSDMVVNILDASNLARHLYLTFQLLETAKPIVLALNMADVAEQRGMGIDEKKLSSILGVPVLKTVGSKKQGISDLKQLVKEAPTRTNNFQIEYPKLENAISELEKFIADGTEEAPVPPKWYAIKAIEEDPDVLKKLEQILKEFSSFEKIRKDFIEEFKQNEKTTPLDYIAAVRHAKAKEIVKQCINKDVEHKRSFSDIADTVICHKILGPAIMMLVVYLLYELSIVQGYKLTNYTWPYLAAIKNFASNVLPQTGLVDIPYSRALGLWVIDSVNALLNYLPIFFILFALVAFLEDVGYMPRMAFILDKLFSRYGLHGQSTLPMVLGGVYVGGCAVPGIMSTKGISDERARIATILIVPLLNCLAKIPFYTLLVNVYFKETKAFTMFFISTVTVMMAVIVSKLLAVTALKNKQTTPFVMEMPSYHLPTIRGVMSRTLERIWLYIKKIITVVAAVAVILFVLLQFPGVPEGSMTQYRAQMDKALATFQKKTANNKYAEYVQSEEQIVSLINFYEQYKSTAMTKKGNALSAFTEKMKEKNEMFFLFIKPKGDADAKTVNRALRVFSRSRQKVHSAMHKERLDKSYLGMAGRFIEPVTKFAGFDWKVNVGILSAFAAKESMVATLGAIYGNEENVSLETSMSNQKGGTTPLHALAMILFMTLYPPCIASMMMVKVQTGSYKWMVFSIFYPMALGAFIAASVFSISSAFGITGMQAMYTYYGIMIAITVALGLIKFEKNNTGGAL